MVYAAAAGIGQHQSAKSQQGLSHLVDLVVVGAVGETAPDCAQFKETSSGQVRAERLFFPCY